MDKNQKLNQKSIQNKMQSDHSFMVNNSNNGLSNTRTMNSPWKLTKRKRKAPAGW